MLRLSQAALEAQAQKYIHQELHTLLGQTIFDLSGMFSIPAPDVVPYILSILPANELFFCGASNSLTGIITLATGAPNGRISIYRTQAADLSADLQQVVSTAFGAGMHKVSVETADPLDVQDCLSAGFRQVGVKRQELLIAGRPVDIVLLERLAVETAVSVPEPQEDEEETVVPITRKAARPKFKNTAPSKATLDASDRDEIQEDDGIEVIETIEMER